MELSGRMKVLSWVLQAVVAVILLQTLFFKFTGAPESVYIFSKLGAEPWGRIASGVFELVATALLLFPRSAVFGALLSPARAADAPTARVFELRTYYTLPGRLDEGVERAHPAV